MTQIKREALAHYDRMIKWAKKTRSKDFRFKVMVKAIGESCGAPDCPYCLKYDTKCAECELHGSKPGSVECCNGLWWEMRYHSFSWKQFAERAQLVRDYIEKHG